MTIKGIDDIEKERNERAKEKVAQDTSEVMDKILDNLGDTLKRKKIERQKKKTFWKRLFGLIGVIILIIIAADILLGSIWLLRFFIKSLVYG
jgi:Flp pilus assembly protein TadB